MTIVPTRAMQLIERSITDGGCRSANRRPRRTTLLRLRRAVIYSRLVERFKAARCLPASRGYAEDRTRGRSGRSAVRQAAIVTSEESRGVDFTFAEGKAVLSGRGAERANRALSCRSHTTGRRSPLLWTRAERERFLPRARRGEDFHLGIERRRECRGLPHRRRLQLRDHAAGPRSVRRTMFDPRKLADILTELHARRGYARVRSSDTCEEAWREAAGNRLRSRRAWERSSEEY